MLADLNEADTLDWSHGVIDYIMVLSQFEIK
jgi:hypothetical protein